MAIERWGSLSVRDHLNLESLITNILLYDRLVLPIPDGIAELVRWKEEKWDPELQRDIIAKLDTLAITRKWDANRQQNYQALQVCSGLDYDIQHVMTEARDERSSTLRGKRAAFVGRPVTG
jgi:hypothetical protein